MSCVDGISGCPLVRGSFTPKPNESWVYITESAGVPYGLRDADGSLRASDYATNSQIEGVDPELAERIRVCASKGCIISEEVEIVACEDVQQKLINAVAAISTAAYKKVGIR